MPDNPVLNRLRSKVAAGDTSGIRVQVRVAGGMPEEQHLDRSVSVDASGAAVARAAEADAAGPTEGSTRLAVDELVAVLRGLTEGAEGLVPRSEARFLPDSVVGSVLVEIDGESTELFYLADEQDRITQDKPIPPATARALAQLQDLGDRIVETGGGEN